MAKQIEGVSEKIEKCAREEFLKNGYTDASLRTIASEAGTTTGSIYSRYGDKEGLFSAIVEPAANEFIEKFRSIQEEFHSMESDRQAESLEDFTMDGMQRRRLCTWHTASSPMVAVLSAFPHTIRI